MTKQLFWIILIVPFIISSCKQEIKTDKNWSQMSIEEIDQLITKDSSHAELFQTRAEKYYLINKIDSALSDYQQAVKLDDSQLDWYVKLSDLHLLKGQSEKARQALDQALKLGPNNTETLLKMGVLYLLIEDHIKSFEYLNQSLSVDPNQEKVYFYKSMNYIELGDTTRAIDELFKAVEKKPEYIDAYIQLGLFHDALGDTMARVYYENALKIDSTNAFAHYDLAMHYQNQEEFNKAIRQYLHLVENVDTNFSTAFHNIGYIYLVYSDDFDTAIEYFDKAIAIDYNFTEAYTNKAYALELLKKYNEAFVEYQTALRINPQHIEAQNGLKRISQFVKQQ